uniref:Transport and Golgi organization protein 1 homolog n=1 Tax=Mola mola TaxID=94237 RepID=A0A3Q3VIA0_MOLML
ANMAAKYFYRQGFLLLLFNFVSTAALEKRFSDFKRCADEECSMLLCRGKAVKDFSGPDCRFLSFKKSETIYVYYKLSGTRADLWAGSVGSNFGYFPKDLLAVNHLYTEKEHEIPAEETDFVCFDTGFDKFDTYDIDSLLGSSLEESDNENEGESDQSQVAEVSEKETPPLIEEAADSDKETEHHDNPEVFVSDDLSASEPELNLDMEAESPTPSTVEAEEAATPDDSNERPAKDTDFVQSNTVGSALENVLSERNETKDMPAELESESVPEVNVVSEKEVSVSVSEGAQIPELKTTFGSTFDAIATDDEITKKVTPYEVDESENAVNPPEDDVDVKKETLLLSFSEEAATNPESDYLKMPESPPTTHDDKQKTAEEKGLSASLGDSPFSVVTGGETTDNLSLEDDKDDDDEEEPTSKMTQNFEETKKEVEESVSVELLKELETKEPVLQEPLSSSIPKDINETNSDFEVLNHTDVTDGDVIEPEEVWEETIKPTDAGTRLVDPVLQDESSDPLQAQKSDFKTAEELTEEEEIFEDLEVENDDAILQDSSTEREHKEDLNNELTENQTVNHQELAEKPMHLSTEESQSEILDVEDNENIADDSVLDQIPSELMTPVESNKSQELPVEQPEIHEEILLEEFKDDKDTKLEEEEEVLLEDENGLSSSQSNSTENEEVSHETTPPTVLTPEPVYSESVMRLTLLQDHFTEEKMELVRKLLGLRNLFKLEAMFSDLDTELQATCRSHTGATQDIENALQGILEASEDTILDEIQKMLESQGTKYSYDQHMDTSTFDAETQILDDFQELALSLRQKYSTTLEANGVPEAASSNNLTLTSPMETREEQKVLDEVHSTPDITVEEDGGHFNKNKDNQPSFSASEEMHKGSQATLEAPLDMGLDVEVERSPPGWYSKQNRFVLFWFLSYVLQYCVLFPQIISRLPEEWKPGETFFGCPWQAVVITALVGVVTFTLFFWRTVLAVSFVLSLLSPLLYLLDEKRLTEQIKALKKEKNEALTKVSELQKQVSWNFCMPLTKVQVVAMSPAVCKTTRKMVVSASLYNCVYFPQTTVRLDEAKIREDARNVQYKCLEKEYAALKEENKTFKVTIKDWEDKHKELNEQIKVYQKAQKELEDSVVLKDHNVEVLSELLVDLDACDLQKGDTKYLANGEPVIKNKIKQMMDVSRVQTTLTVVEEERDRFMTKLLKEEKARKSLEEQHQELEHAIATLKSEKSHVENQFKILQQKNDIMVEMYQQKENALQQRLTKEELERRSKENMLSEVGGKALEAEEQVKVLRQRINEMEEQMKKTEEVYKEQVVNARNAERALNQEKLESSKLRENLPSTNLYLTSLLFLANRLAVMTSQLNERRDSYGPSPVSGGAPSPPLMIEGPRRPPSAPLGRRIDPYGESQWITSPWTSAPPLESFYSSYNLSLSTPFGPFQGPGSFLASPIRESPGPIVQGPPPGPHDLPLLPGPPPSGRLPPPGPYRLPRPGACQLPPGLHGPPPPPHGPPLPLNGHPGMPMPGPLGGEFGPRPSNGLIFHPRLGPGHVVDPRGPPPPHFRPPPPHHFGPMPLPPGMFYPLSYVQHSSVCTVRLGLMTVKL